MLLGPDLTLQRRPTFGDAFVAKVAAGGAGLDYCGYIGGSGDDFGCGIAVDSAFTATVTGVTASTEASFPVTVGPDLIHNGGNDAFVARVSSSDFTLGATPRRSRSAPAATPSTRSPSARSAASPVP